MCGRQELGIGCDNDNGKTTAQMQGKSTFLGAGWDFVGESPSGTEGIWIICDGLDYPEFARQFVTGDFDGDNRVGLADFAFFAERWLSADRRFLWCRGADLTGDGEVGVDDLREFADNWLAEGAPNLTGTVYLTPWTILSPTTTWTPLTPKATGYSTRGWTDITVRQQTAPSSAILILLSPNGGLSVAAGSRCPISTSAKGFPPNHR